MGLEFRESALSITNKNAKVIREGMVFNISPGFHNLERKGTVADPKKKVYSMMIADTVVVSVSYTHIRAHETVLEVVLRGLR